MNIFCTGISGIDKKGFWNNVKEYAEKKNKEVNTYSIGDLIFETANKVNFNLNQKNVLNTNEETLAVLRSNAFNFILSDYHTYENNIIQTHVTFFWDRVFKKAFDAKYLSTLDVDLFITLIDNEVTLEETLSKTDQWSGINKLSKEDILFWQNIEVLTTEYIAEIKAGMMAESGAEVNEKKHYVFPKSQPVEDIYKLMFVPGTEIVYASYPMTNMDKAGRKKIDAFVEELRKYFIVLDPKSIELSKNYCVESGAQTVERDTEWYINKISKVFVYFPDNVDSPGVNTEMAEAKHKNKDIYTIFPSDRVSPFILHNSNYNVFKTKEEVFGRLKEKGYMPLEF